MNLGYAHCLVVSLAITISGVVAAFHGIGGSEFQTITIGGLGSLTGHGIGYAHGMQTAIQEQIADEQRR